MSASHETEALIVALLVAVAALIVGAQRSRIPYPIFLVVGGLVIGAVPGLPDIRLAPELVLVIALPPLLYSAGFFSNLRELQANVRPIGPRGAVSLAAALAIPTQTDAGAPFPGRDLIVFCTLGVIIATLCLQGLSLPPLIKALGVTDGGRGEREETKARIAAAEAALRRVEELREAEWVREDTADRMRGLLDYRRRRFAARFDEDDDGGYEERSNQYQRVQREVLDAQRAALVELRNSGRINDETMRRVQRELDLEDSRLEI